ncbi:MAG: FimB/Mfa2 family fimbrial subunit, partial [Muribaculaceae bacterium]|nr:FimB/Mfa2 family fimbrial subunit [Muribaculaceae bacterium]
LPDEPLTYHPWSLSGGTASFFPEDQPDLSTRAQTDVNAVVGELTVGRLMADRRKDVALTVRNSHTGANILSIPLIDYLLLVKGHYYSENGISPMSDQEYLDRQDDYPLTFFLDENDHWIKTVIYINSWRVVINDSSLH